MRGQVVKACDTKQMCLDVSMFAASRRASNLAARSICEGLKFKTNVLSCVYAHVALRRASSDCYEVGP